MLLDAGADIEATNDVRAAPLDLHAIRHANEESVKLAGAGVRVLGSPRPDKQSRAALPWRLG